MSQSDRPTQPAERPSLEEMKGFNADLGFRLVEWADGYAKIELTLREKHLNRSGIIHGGVLATIVDAVGGYCGVWVPPGEPMKRALTLTLTTSFLGQATEGAIVAVAKRRGGGKSVFFAACEVFNQAGELIAIGEGTYKLRGQTPKGE